MQDKLRKLKAAIPNRKKKEQAALRKKRQREHDDKPKQTRKPDEQSMAR